MSKNTKNNLIFTPTNRKASYNKPSFSCNSQNNLACDDFQERSKIFNLENRVNQTFDLPMKDFDTTTGMKDAYRMLVKQINWETSEFERKKKYYTDLTNKQNEEIKSLERQLYEKEVSGTLYNPNNYQSMQPTMFETNQKTTNA